MTQKRSGSGRQDRPKTTPPMPRDARREEGAPAAPTRRTEARRGEREKEARRRRLTTLGIVVGAIAALVLIVVLLRSQPAEAPIPEASAARYDGLTQGVTAEGYPRLGDRDAARQVSWYCNFDSPECAAFHDAFIDPAVELVRAGEISLVYVPLYGRVGNAQGAASAAVCAAPQNAFWTLMDALYAWQRQFGEIQAFTNNRLVAGVDQLGVTRGEYDSCVTGGRAAEVLQRANADTRGLVGFANTPAVAVNGVVLTDDQGAQLTNALAILDVLRAAPEATAEATAEATSEPTPEPLPEAAEATPEATETRPAPTGDATVEATDTAG